MTNLNDLTLAEINEQIELLEVAERFGTKLEEFTDWLSTFAGGEAVNWVSDDPTVQFVLGGLKDAAFEFSETLGGFSENFEPLTDAAGAAGNINTAVQTALSIVTAIDELEEDVDADKAGQLADILGNLTSLSQLLTSLSLNPIIGVFIGLYATALKSAMIPIQIIADQVAIRDDVVESSTAGIDIAAEQAAQEAADDAAAEAQLAITEQLNAFYARRGELIAALQGSQYVVALDFAASRHPDEMQELIDIASEQGGITSDAPINGETLGQIETWVGSATDASFDLMTEAAAAPEGSEARANAINRLNTLNDARQGVTELLGPIRGTVTGALETYGYSTADPGPQASVPQAAGTAGGIAGLSRRAVMIGGGGIFAVAMVGLVLLLPGGGGDAGTPGESGGSSPSSSGGSASSGSSSSGSSSSGSSGATSSGPTPRSGPAVVIQPCLVIDQARAASLLGTATGPIGVSEEEREKICVWEQSPGADLAVASNLYMSISRNSAGGAGMLEAWRSHTADANEVRGVPWAELGELRIEINQVGDEYSTVMLFALAFNSDASSGDVYLMLIARGPVDAAASNAAMLETVAEELRGAVLAAQP